MRFGLDENIIEKITKVFENQPKVDKAFIFGSRAKGNYRADSDIDIAVKGYDLTVEDILKMSAAIEKAAIGFEVDLVDYDSIKEKALKDHVDRIGIEFYNSWKNTKLGDLIEQKRASLQTGPFGTMLNASEYSVQGTPVIAVQDIGDNSLTHNKLVYVNQDVSNRLSRYRVQEGDIIFGRKGAVERRALIKKNESGWIQGSDCIRLRFDDSVDSTFISYQLGSDSMKEWMHQFSTGATMPSLNQEVLRLLPLQLPPLSYQLAVSNILTTLDLKIDLLRHQNKTLESMAETLFKQWFIEQANEDWEEKSLTQIANYLNGIALQNYPEKGNGHLAIIKIREMKQGNTENADLCDINIPSEYLINNGDVLFSWSGSLDIVLWAGEKGALNQHLFKVTSREYPKWFYYLATKYHLKYFRAVAESKSTTMGHIQRHHLENASVKIPSKEIFEKMDASIKPLIERKITNNQQILSIISLRDALLPNLLSGEARVKMS